MDEPSLRFESFGLSHAGRVRELNEDRYLIAPRSGLWLVADGMGGHDAGEIASASIVEHLATLGVASSAPDLRARFEDRIVRANAQIWAIAQARGGTTIGSHGGSPDHLRQPIRLHLGRRQPDLPGARRRAIATVA